MQFPVYQPSQLVNAVNENTVAEGHFETLGGISTGDTGYLASVESWEISGTNVVLHGFKTVLPPLDLVNANGDIVKARNIVVEVDQASFPLGSVTANFRVVPNENLAEVDIVIGNTIRQAFTTTGVTDQYTTVIFDEAGGDISVHLGTFQDVGGEVDFTPSTTDTFDLPLVVTHNAGDEYLTKAANLSDVEDDAESFDNIKQQASEAYVGATRYATEAEVTAGLVDDAAVTPAHISAGVAANVPDATTTVKGKVELATNGEANAGADNVRAVVPSNLPSAVPANMPNASTSTKGKVELATNAETDTGTDSTRAVTPAGLQHKLDQENFPEINTSSDLNQTNMPLGTYIYTYRDEAQPNYPRNSAASPSFNSISPTDYAADYPGSGWIALSGTWRASGRGVRLGTPDTWMYLLRRTK